MSQTSTTIKIPASTSAYIAYGSNVPVRVNPTGKSPLVTYSAGFSLWIPFTGELPPNVNVDVLNLELELQILRSTPSAITETPSDGSPAAVSTSTHTAGIGPSRTQLSSPSVITPDFTNYKEGAPFYALSNEILSPISAYNTISPPSVLYVPVNVPLPQFVDADALASHLATIFDPSSTLTSSNQATSSTSSSDTNTTTPNPTPHTTGISAGVLAGSVAGAFVLSCLVLGLFVVCCFRGRRRRVVAMPSSTSDAGHGMPTSEKTLVATWEKHLPQEKDDKTLTKAFESLLMQVQIHLEAFYGAKAGSITRENEESLTQIAPMSTVKLLQQKSIDAVPVLESILVRTIVDRISLRSDPQDSFLPPEYTSIPHQNGWHMGGDEYGASTKAESRRGFTQAFAQWRRLGAFLRADTKSVSELGESLSQRIETVTQSVVQAFAPWEIRERSNVDRHDNFRTLFHQASEVGMMLFAQPSTFMFDWTGSDQSGSKSIVVAPALVKRLQGNGEALSRPQILLKARETKI
ncbi:hypothetical protein K461DRAFT_317081 [Myriangium duriaei CBS 260.36]|uniref:Uncharacterized protein n=1 Tax=Myriangium duriaei CBS 260.36 TaxID=1168546 RepID=A0A9P4ML12_9PEZI|nr:hypothetical protein K461DRAFT_317081 [Myriangium duriaei CBS 260.36]